MQTEFLGTSLMVAMTNFVRVVYVILLIHLSIELKVMSAFPILSETSPELGLLDACELE